MGQGHGGIGRESESAYLAFKTQGVPLTTLVWRGNLTWQFSGPSVRPRTPRRLALVWSLLSGRNFPIRIPANSTLYLPQVLPFSPRQRGGKNIVRLHDLFPITNPDWFTKHTSVLFQFALKRLVETGAEFIPTSHTSEAILMQHYPQARSLGVLHCYIPPLENCSPCGFCEGCRLVLPSFYFLAVGTVEPRKNYSLLVKIAQDLINSKIVVVGRFGWKSKRDLKALQSNKNIIYVGKVCDGSLAGLYQNARAFISTSINEGFNIPAQEAKHFGTPLVLSDIPVHRELHSEQMLLSIHDSAEWVTALNSTKFEKKYFPIPTFKAYSERMVSIINIE